MKKHKVIFYIMIIALIIIVLFNKFKPGYVFENGTWNYISYDTGVGRRVTPVDIDKDEFKKLNYKDFARDDKYVYFKAYRIEGSDPDTFEVISTGNRRHYAKDKNFVYIYVRDGWDVYKVINADPNTFEVLEFPYAKDKKDAYNCCLPLYVDDVNEFEVIEGGGFSTETSADVFLGNTDIELTEKDKQDVEYNKEKYGFIKDAGIYSEDGRAKTENLVYEGYMIIEDKR